MSATINGKKIAAMSYGGKKIASAWMGGKMVWSGVKPSSNDVREWIFPTRSDGNIQLSEYLQRAFGGDLYCSSGDIRMLANSNLPQLAMPLAGMNLDFGASAEAFVRSSAEATPAAASEWIIAAKLSSTGSGYSGSAYPTNDLRLYTLAPGVRYVGVKLSTNAESCGLLTQAPGDTTTTFTRSTVSTNLPANHGGPDWGELTIWYKDGWVRYYRNFSLIGSLHLPFRMDDAPVIPALQLRASKQGSFFYQKLAAPPRVNYLAVYTGKEAASRAKLWKLKE